MFLGFPLRQVDGILGDLCSQTVVGTECFLWLLLACTWSSVFTGEASTLQFWQWQSDVRASSGDASFNSYSMLRQ